MDTNIGNSELSVIMIVHNGDRYIEKAIDSILVQTYSEFEFLILNDGSTDDTEHIILSCQKKDQRIKYLSNSDKKGLSYSRNRIIREAKGKYILTADADDISLKNRLEIQMQFIKNNPNIDIVGSSIVLMNDEDTIFDTWSYPENNNEIIKSLINGCSVANPASLFKKEVFNKLNGYNESLTICEDWDFFYRASKYFTFHNINEPLIYYRIHNNNISKNKLEHTIVFSTYLQFNLDPKYINSNILQLSELLPDKKEFLAEKVIQFYSFWIDTYGKLGYKQLSKELYNSVLNNFLPVFNKAQLLKFKRFCLSIFLRNNFIVESFKILLNLK